jgi:branched-chain amino acid transport system permease protein
MASSNDEGMEETGSSWSLLARATTFAVAAILVMAAPFILGEGYQLHLLITSAIFAILASSLSLIVGYAGLLSLGHVAFFGIGAYTSALLFLNLGIPMWGGIPAAMLVGAASAFLIGIIILRVRGHRFVITTLVFTEIMRLVAVNWVDLTRGQMGLPGIRAPVLHVPGWGTIDFTSKIAFYFVAVAAAALCVGTIARIVPSPIGWGLLALRENEQLGESVGVSAFRHALIAFVVGGCFAGLAGALYAHYMSFVSPDLFSFTYTSTLLVMVFIGGKATIFGPVLGAALFTYVPEYLRITDRFRLMFIGAILLAVVIALPGGLMSAWSRWTTMQRFDCGKD